MISYRTLISNKGKIIIGKRLFINLLTNTCNANDRDYSIIDISQGGRFLVEGQAFISSGFKLSVSGDLTIGNNTYLMARSSIICRKETVIGKNCAISWDTTIMDSDLHSINKKNAHQRVCIGDRVWIGANAKILKGVKIGDGAIIAANSLVTKNVSTKTLVAGNPARVIRKNVDWE